MTPSRAVHIWSHCHHCGMNPVVGPLFRCETCPLGAENDLCSSCYEGYLAGRVVHPEPDSASANTERGIHLFALSEGKSPEQYAQWLGVDGPTPPPPPVPPAFLVRPEFRSGRDSVFGGYGFAIWFQAHVYLLTALHVMDELIKRKKIDATANNCHYSGEELPAYVSSVRLYDVLKDQWPLYELGNAGPMLVLPNARTGDEEPFAYRDIAAFRLASLCLVNVGVLAERDPKPGDPLWLAAAMPDRTRTRRAVCVESTSRTLIFRYTETKEMAKYSSGAPILDDSGAVVGINTGLGRFEGSDFGHANPVSSIRSHLAEVIDTPRAALAVAVR